MGRSSKKRPWRPRPPTSQHLFRKSQHKKDGKKDNSSTVGGKQSLPRSETPANFKGNHTPHSSHSQPLDSATMRNTHQLSDRLFNERYDILRIKFTDRLRTHMYGKLHAKLYDKLDDKLRPEQYDKLGSASAMNHEHYKKWFNQFYKDYYIPLSIEVSRNTSNELYDELLDEFDCYLLTQLHSKLSNDLHSYLSTQLRTELHANLYHDLYNQLSHQMADLVDGNHLPSGQNSLAPPSAIPSLSSIPASKSQDEDNHHHHHQQQQHDQQKQEQPQQPPMTHDDGSPIDADVSPQPSSSFTITSTDGQLNIPLLGDMAQFRIRSYNVTPFALHIMLLCVLAKNPDILLPLASLKKCFFDHIHQLNEEYFCGRNIPARCNGPVIKMVIAVTCTRLNYAINRLYPPSKEEISADQRKRVIQELENGPCPILQDIIRDSLSVYNPMRVLLSYLRSLTTRYDTLSDPTPEERKAFEKNVVLRSYGWMYELHHLCSLYGLYLWDSQWMTDEEWKELAQHMEIFYTKISPHVKDDFAIMEGFGEKQVDIHSCCVNRVFKSILRCIASCFAFRYRPMKDPSWLNVPYGRRPFWVDVDPVLIETDVHRQSMQVFPDVLKQCVTECMNNPTTTTLMQSPLADSRLKDKYLLTASDTIAKSEEHTSTHDYIMAELEYAFENAVDGWAPGDLEECKSVKWTPKIVGYGRDDMTPHMVYLIDCIVKHPPTVDPVYELIKDVFPEEVNLSNIISDGCFPLSGDPGFKCHESSS